MDARRRLARVVALVAFGGTVGCADLVGADFDVHRAPPKGPEAARDTGDGAADRSEPPSNSGRPDAGSDVHALPDGAPNSPDTAASDVGKDTPTRDDSPAVVADATDGELSDGGRDVDEDRHRSDASDEADPPEGGDIPDVPDPGDGGRDRDDADGGARADGPDGRTIDGGAEPPPDAPRSTGITGSFVSLGVLGGRSPAIELHGYFISETAIRGVTSSGITIEGKIQ